MALFCESISEFVNGERELNKPNLKYELGDRIYPIDLDVAPTISYDYLFLDPNHTHSFHNDELNEKTCEEIPDKSDYAIYFEKIKSFCKRPLGDSIDKVNYQEHIHVIPPNRKLKELLKLASKKSSIENIDLPQFGQFALYTNRGNSKAPRIFFFIGNYAIIYVLFYDPYHEIFPSTT